LSCKILEIGEAGYRFSTKGGEATLNGSVSPVGGSSRRIQSWLVVHVFQVDPFKIGVTDLGSGERGNEASVLHDPHASTRFLCAE
jgi:hypothetical protein